VVLNFSDAKPIIRRFLIQVFDEWVHNDVGKIYVQTFEAALRNWLQMDTSGMCVFEKTCGYGLALEHNGDLYSCDHFVEPDYLLGNIKEEHMLQMVGSDEQTRFGQAKYDSLPKYCLECPVLFACNGECPKNRFIETPDGEAGLNYLCAGYKAFFQCVDEPMKIMAALLRGNRPTSDVMGILAEQKEVMDKAYKTADREKPCPCGSQLSFKECHGWVRSRRKRRGRRSSAVQPRPPVRAVSQ